jgi:hypothetical protein
MHCRLELNDFPITFDDTFYFSFELAKNIPVLCINASDPNIKTTDNLYLNTLFGVDSLFILKNVKENNLDYSTLSNNKLIVLNGLKSISSGLSQELKRFVSNGGSLLIFPNAKCDLNSYQEFLTSVKTNYYEALDSVPTKVDKINLENPIYKDVFDKKTFSTSNLNLPIVNKHFIFSKSTRSNEEYLLKLQNGDAFLSKYDVGKGKIYLSSVPLQTDFSNFPKHSLFVPTLYKIGIYSQTTQPLFYTIGNNPIIELNDLLTTEKVYHIRSLNAHFDIIPEHKVMDSKTEINVHNQITNAGNYNLFSDKDLISGFAFNFNRIESDLSCPTSEELKDQLTTNNINNIRVLKTEHKDLKAQLTEVEQGKSLWKLCIILALLFLAVEVLLIRFMKG